MDSQFVSELRDLWCEHGSDLQKWPDDARREVAIALYRADERLPERNRRYWLNDALVERLAAPEHRATFIDALAQFCVKGQRIDAAIAVSSLVFAVMVFYPMDSIQEELNDRLPDFLAWQRENQAKLDADSVNDAVAN